jgi:hypothetical protein
MEKLEQYRQLIKEMLWEYSQYKPVHGEIEVETIFDTERDHYQVMNIGWDQERFIHSCSIHVDIKNGKIWIQWNSTELEIAEELVAAGVPKDDIVIGFQPPFMRQFTEYAVG